MIKIWILKLYGSKRKHLTYCTYWPFSRSSQSKQRLLRNRFDARFASTTLSIVWSITKYCYSTSKDSDAFDIRIKTLSNIHVENCTLKIVNLQNKRKAVQKSDTDILTDWRSVKIVFNRNVCAETTLCQRYQRRKFRGRCLRGRHITSNHSLSSLINFATFISSLDRMIWFTKFLVSLGFEQ